MTRRIRSKCICQLCYASDCRKRVKRAARDLETSILHLLGIPQAFKSKKVAIRRKLPSFFLHRQRSDKKMLMPLTQIQDGKWLMTTLSRRTNSSQQVESRDPSSLERLMSPARLFRDLSLRLDHRTLQLLAKPT